VRPLLKGLEEAYFQRGVMTIIRTILIAAVLCSAAAGQSVAGSGAIGGFVRDNYGDGLPDTKVTIYNKVLGFERTVATTDDGVFQAPGLAPAPNYVLKISRSGFADWESQPFEVPVGQTLNFRIQLEPDAPAAWMHTHAGYIQETSKTGMALVFNESEIATLPANPRRIDALTPQAPVVNTTPGNDRVAILGTTIGQPLFSNGVVTGDGYFTDGTLRTSQTSLYAVQEFQVLGANASAEFGRAMSGMVNSVLQSGTNLYHGTGYGYNRLPGLTAVGRFSDGQKLLRGQYRAGGNLSGPIIRDKLFVFVNVETMSGHFDGLNRITNQLVADSTASYVPTSNCKATTLQCAAAVSFIQSQMNVLVPLSERWANGVARIDYRPDPWNAFSFAANLTNSLAPDGKLIAAAASNGGLLGIRNTREDPRFFNADWTTTPDPAVTNILRFGESQDHLSEPSSTSGLSTGNVSISVAGVNVGNANPNSYLLDERRYQLLDNVSFASGSHTIQGGFDVSKSRFYVDQVASAGQYYYSSLTNFAQDLSSAALKDYTLFTQTLGAPARRFPLGDIGIYGQDTWRARPDLTVVFGLRWDKSVTPHPAQTNTSFYDTTHIYSASLNLAPRLGVSWRMDDKTDFRFGFGLYYAPLSGQLMDALYIGNAQSQANIAFSPGQTGSLTFPKTVSSFSAIPTGTAEVEYAGGKVRNPRSEQLTLAADRRLGANTVTLSLINASTSKLWTATDDNLATSTKSITYTIDNAEGTAVDTFSLPVYTARNTTSYSHLYNVGNNGSGRYTAVSIELRRAMSHGVTIQGSYTLSHAIDDTGGLLIAGGIPLLDSNSGFTSNRDSSATDQRHRFVVNATWQPRFLKSNGIAARYLVNGWQLSTIGTVASGQPVTALVIANETQYSGVTPLFPYTLDGSGGWSREPFGSVASYRTGTQRNVNARLARSIPITERIKGLLAFEAFNALNSQWDTAVNSIAYSSSAGVLKPVAGAGTGASATNYPYGTNARSAQASFRIVF
jgi:Carboxypeptidase regulatory-like domain/TonB dependent receptor